MELSTEARIEQAVQQQKVAAPNWMSHEEKAGFHVGYPKGFTAGASFATSDPLILQSLLQPFAEWINERYCNDGDLKLWRELGTLNYYSDEELIAKYIQFITDKQK